LTGFDQFRLDFIDLEPEKLTLNTLPAISFLAFLAAPAVQINSLPTARYIFPQKVQTTFFFTIADKIREPGRKSRFFGPKTCFDHFLVDNCLKTVLYRQKRLKTSKNVKKRPKNVQKRPKTVKNVPFSLFGKLVSCTSRKLKYYLCSIEKHIKLEK